MRKILVLVALVAIMAFSSCHTQRFVVYGQPGTYIKTIDGSKTLAVIGSDGTANVKVDIRGGYDPFLQAIVPGSERGVPFALDYKDAHRNNWLTVGSIFALLPSCGLGSMYLLACFGDYKYLKKQKPNNDLIRVNQ